MNVLEAGIDSLKIEGRMKTALYVATVARTYRKAIDDYLKDPAPYREHMPWYQEQIKAVLTGSLPLDFSMESQMKPRRFTTTIRTKKAIRILVILKGAERTAVTVSPRGISSCWAKR